MDLLNINIFIAIGIFSLYSYQYSKQYSEINNEEI